MICKNAVESILEERKILISVCNPFVVSMRRIIYTHFMGVLHVKACYSNVCDFTGSIFLLLHMQGKSVSGHGISKRWRSVLFIEKLGLLG